ncbi:MAG TPA: hypothetical protein VHB98_18545 [Chloroflexota bacterium]|nr:hypothetical protein [Chloroflexota bacterium]
MTDVQVARGRRAGRRWWRQGSSRSPRILLLAGFVLCVAAVIAIVAHGVTGAPTTQTAAAPLPLNGRWVPTPLQDQITALLHEPGQPSVLLAAATSGVWRSADAGATWQPDGTGVRNNPVFVLADTATSQDVWAGSFDGSVYVRESAAGQQAAWRRISPVLLTNPQIGAIPVYSLAVSPQQGHPLLTGSLGAIFRAEPSANGRTWRWQRVWRWQPPAHSNLGDGAITSLVVAPWNAQIVFASVFQATPSVLISHDGGHSWAPDPSGPPAILPSQDLIAGDQQARQVFLTTMGGGVWQREADGRWQDISAGLPQRHAMPLLATGPAASGVLYAGTMGLGVYEKQQSAPWRHLGQGLNSSATIVMSLAETPGPHPLLLAGTTHGVYRYKTGG